MAKVSRIVLGLLIVLALMAFTIHQVQASKGVPGSPEFGYGAAIHPEGPVYNEALSMAAELNPDWLYVPLSWSFYAFEQASQPNFTGLDPVMQVAAQNGTPVAVSITSAPAWAMTPQGPDPVLTSQFVISLLQRYPGVIQAVEIFPRANTSLGWGSAPNPQNYMNLFRSMREQLQAANLPVLLVAAGLQPLGLQVSAVDMDDLVFLQGLYDAGGRNDLQVVSIQYVNLTGQPLNAASSSENRTLRHYEQVRQVMTANQHMGGLLWVTHLSLPNGSINLTDAEVNRDAQSQAIWLQQAYVQLRSQLYIGAAFLQSFNQGLQEPSPSMAMLQQGGARHPFYADLNSMINQDEQPGDTSILGKPKAGSLGKQRP